MAETKRQQTKDKVEAGQARNRAKGKGTALDRAGETAIEAKDRFAAFAREHPIATVAGGLAVGVLISGLFKGSPTRKLGEKVGTRAAGLAAIGTELALAYAQQAMDAADHAGRKGAHKLGDLGDTIGSTARSLRRSGSDTADSASKRIARALHGRFG
jgi:hypothetical protein